MNRAFDLNSGCDIQVYVDGPPGPPLVSVGSFVGPIMVDGGTIAAPIWRWQRSFIQAAIGVLNQPSIPAPADNGSWLIGLQVVGGFPITLNDSANIKLSGQWIGNPDSILWLLWDGNSRYVESGRNEI